MKITLLLLLFSGTVLFYAFNENKPDNITRIGCTELNGNGCVCHSVEEDTSVHVWVTGPDTVYAGEKVLYKMFMTGGPAQAGGYNVACRFGVLDTVGDFSFWDYRDPNELTQAYSLPINTTTDTVYWPFLFIASGKTAFDTIYSTGLSLVWDSIPDFHDRWAYGLKKRITVLPKPLSVNEINSTTPQVFSLNQNYPNPFNPETNIQYSIKQSGFINITVFNVLGEKIKTLINRYMEKGEYNVKFNALGLPGGIYLYKMESPAGSLVKKMLLLN